MVSGAVSSAAVDLCRGHFARHPARVLTLRRGRQVRARHGQLLLTGEPGLDLDDLAVGEPELDLDELSVPSSLTTSTLPLPCPPATASTGTTSALAAVCVTISSVAAAPLISLVSAGAVHTSRSPDASEPWWLLLRLLLLRRRPGLGPGGRRLLTRRAAAARLGGRRRGNRAGRQRGDRAEHRARERAGPVLDLRLDAGQPVGDLVGLVAVDVRDDAVPGELRRRDRHAGGDGGAGRRPAGRRTSPRRAPR